MPCQMKITHERDHERKYFWEDVCKTTIRTRKGVPYGIQNFEEMNEK